MQWLRPLPSPKNRALCKPNCDTIKEALSFCENECDCNPLRTPGFRPTRLLDLSAWEKSNKIKLVDTSSMANVSELHYAALSYCWGPASDAALQLKTTAATITAHLEHIQANSLTPVIKDAVEATRALSLDYLWIDALCIIQGDDEDWAKESERMESVYANSYCTICAAASSTCLDGFLERKPPVVIGFKSTLQSDVVGHFNLRHVCSSGVGDLWIPYSAILIESDAGAWSSRGWTFQEEYLSARKVIFGPLRVFYSCPRREWTEPSIWQDSSSSLTMASMVRRYEGTDSQHLVGLWMEILSDYIGRQLTVPCDVFPAISGLAKAIAQKTRNTYVAGLWTSDLMRQCLWQGHRGIGTLEELIESLTIVRKDYICPSWSWGRQHTVNFHSRRRGVWVSEYETLTAWATPHSKLNPWGRITDAHLELRARYMTIDGVWTRIAQETTRSHFHEWKLHLSGRSQIVCSLDWDDEAVTSQHFRGVTFALMSSRQEIESESAEAISEDSDDDQESEDGLRETEDATSFCASTSSQADSSSTSSSDPGSKMLHGLILFSLADGGSIRIGIFEMAASQENWQHFSKNFKDFDVV